MEELDYQQFIQRLKKKSGIDLAQYKETQMKRRLTSLREKRGYNTFENYFKAVDQDDVLYKELLDRITINVTEFYRNTNRWDVLEKKIVPMLMQQKGANKRLKVWSAACSTGEEPFSLVLLLTRFFPLQDINVLATDLDVLAIQKAKAGIYHERSLINVPKDLKDKYFKRSDQQQDHYALDAKIKERVTFQQQNLLQDSFQTNFDLILCRNVMIYFTEEAKDILYSKFSQALNEQGILFVGSTEQIFNPAKYSLTSVDTFFYRKG